MHILKYFIVLSLFTLVLVAGVFFSIQNTTAVPLDLLIVQLPEQRVALWVLLAFVIGGLVGMGISSYTVLRLKGESALLRRKLAHSKNDLGKSRQRDAGPSAVKG